MIKQYAMYLRKSRADLDLEALGSGETLARHKTMLMDLASRYEILPDQITIYNEVVSGESIAARPKMQQLLNDVYLKKYAGVLVVEVERLARGNTKDQGEVADAFQYSNTKIITPSKIYDPNNEFDQEYFEFGLFMSRREYKTIKRRMEAGRMQSVHEGNYVGSCRPYGYNIQRNNKKERILVINEAEAPIVQMIFNWFTIERKSTGNIAKDLTRMKIPTMTGKTEWNRGTVIDILKNSHYVGKVRWNRRKTSKEYDLDSGSLNKKKRRLTPSDYLEYPGKHQPIISQDQFDAAQKLFGSNVPIQIDADVVNPLAGLLICKDCKKAMVYQKYREGTAPRFAHKDTITCTKKSCAAPVVISSILEALQIYLDDFTVKLENPSLDQSDANYGTLLDPLERELIKQEKKKARLFDSWEADDGTYTKEEFIERKKICTEAIDELKMQIKILKDNKPEEKDYKEKTVTLKQTIDLLKDDSVSAKAKNDFLKSIIDCIEYDVVDLGRNKGCKPVLDVYLI